MKIEKKTKQYFHSWKKSKISILEFCGVFLFSVCGSYLVNLWKAIFTITVHLM